MAFGAATTKWQDWQRGGPLWTLALSPDGKRIVSTDGIGNIMIHNAEDGTELLRWLNVDPAAPADVSTTLRTVWNAAFLPDGRRLATSDRGGFLRIWNSETGDLVTSVPILRPQVGRTLAVSPDGNLIACSTDWANDPNHLLVWNVGRAEWTHQQVTDMRTFSLAFARDGRRLVGANYGGFVSLWNVAADGALSGERRFGPVGAQMKCAAFSADEKSIFAVADFGDGQLSQWDAETGEELWRCPRLEQGLEWVAILNPDRVVTIGIDGRVRLWQRRSVSERK
jgi:WD40 repeat protein